MINLINFSTIHETALAKLCFEMKKVIWFAQQASYVQKIGLAALNYINRREMSNDSNERLFNVRQIEKIMLKYCGHWIGIIRYLRRTHKLKFIDVSNNDNHSPDDDNDQFDQYRFSYKLTVK